MYRYGRKGATISIFHEQYRPNTTNHSASFRINLTHNPPLLSIQDSLLHYISHITVKEQISITTSHRSLCPQTTPGQFKRKEESRIFTHLRGVSMATAVRPFLRARLCRSISSMAEAAPGPPRLVRSGTGLDLVGAKEYEDYRRSLYGEITHKAILVDAVGTLFVPSQPMAQIYRQIGEKYGVKYSENEILNRYRRAYEQPWGASRLRYVQDGRPFWQFIVSSSTGCSDSRYFEELYQYYTTDKAWHLCDPDAERVFRALRKAGVKAAVVSNFDTRLRPLMQALKCDQWFDAVAVSAEVAAEKPNPIIFLKACELLGVKPEDAVHIGDDRRNDVWGARDAGCDAWLWGSDVHSFKEVAERIGVQV